MRSFFVLFCVFGQMAAAASPMNGQYFMANAPDGSPVNVRDAFRGESIDVYSLPISSVYGEVYWTVQDPVPHPPDYVQRFKDDVVVFTGYVS